MNAPTMSSNIYRKLHNSLDEIRLLSATSSSEAGTGWELTTFALGSSPPFAALSYLWGTAARTVNIRVNGQVSVITPELACALKHVSGHWQQLFPSRDAADFYLWTDALCINQSDVGERAEQVRMMGRLYSRAEIVMGSLAC